MDPLDMVPWTSGTADCNDCGYHWAGVWQMGCPDLECPHCGSTDTDRTSEDL